MRAGDRVAAQDYLRYLQQKSLEQFGQSALDADSLAVDDSLGRILDDEAHLFPEAMRTGILNEIRTALNRQRESKNYENPQFQGLVHDLAMGLESVFKLNDGSAFSPPVIGVLPGGGMSAVFAKVPMSDAVVIGIPEQLMFFCNLIARSMSRLINPRPTRGSGGLRYSLNPDDYDFSAKKTQAAVAQVADVILAHAAFGGSWFHRLPPIGRRHSLVRDMLLDAMETFALAHEYGHYLADHHLEEGASAATMDPTNHVSYQQELEADVIGQDLTTHWGKKKGNIFSGLNLGAVVFLSSCDFVTRARRILETGYTKYPASPTHPDLATRLKNLREPEHWPLQALPSHTVKCQGFLEEMISVVWPHVEESSLALHRGGFQLGEVGDHPPFCRTNC